jgi:hypothetical protein
LKRQMHPMILEKWRRLEEACEDDELS